MSEKEIREKYRVLTKYLLEKGLWITTMESCTSGQIASLITDTEGASGAMKGAFITYSNEVKILTGVPAELIDTYGVYSSQVARSMAEVCRKKLSADIGIGVTGTMGNIDPNNSDSVPGNVYFAIAQEEGCVAFHREIPVKASRYEYKLAVAEAVVDELLRMRK